MNDVGCCHLRVVVELDFFGFFTRFDFLKESIRA